MGLDLEYFKNQIHVTDLQKLNENELKFIIRLFEDVLEEFKKNLILMMVSKQKT